jgi:hypothetical protein
MQEEKRRNAAKIAAYEAALAAEAAAGIAPAPRKPVASVVQDLSPYPGFAPQGPVYGPASPADVAAARADWVKENPTPTDTALTQRVVAQNNLSNQQATTRPRSALSAHAQAAKIRGQWAANRAPAPSYPRPMTAPRQNQLILATQAQQGGLGTGAKIAVAGLAAVAILSLGALLFGGR